jgi:hypothetical protein
MFLIGRRHDQGALLRLLHRYRRRRRLPDDPARRHRLPKQFIKLRRRLILEDTLPRPLSVILVVVVVLLNDMDLPADLAGGKRCGMDIGVGSIRSQRVH